MLEKEKEIPNMTYYGDYPLFTEVADYVLRNKNRGTMMANIIEKFSKKGLISHFGLLEVQGYMEMIPDDERDISYERMVQVLKERGWEVEEHDG